MVLFFLIRGYVLLSFVICLSVSNDSLLLVIFGSSMLDNVSGLLFGLRNCVDGCWFI